MLLVCFGLCACEEEVCKEEVNTKYTLKIYVDNEIYQTVELEESEIETYTLPTLDLQKDNLYYFSGWTGDIENGILKIRTDSTSLTLNGSYNPIYSVSEDGELNVDVNSTTKSFKKLVVPSKIGEVDITSLGSYRFQNFNNLEQITLPMSLEIIDFRSFENCSNLKEIIIDESSNLKEIQLEAFKNCTNLKSILIPENVTTIGEKAFENCCNLEIINYNAIQCLDFIDIDDNRYKLCFDNTGTNTSGITINIGNRVTKIPAGFCWNLVNVEYINVKYVNFSENAICETIETFAFTCCKNLEKVTIPASVKTIGAYAFDDCYGLTEINYNAKNIPDPQHSSTGNSKFLNAGKNSNKLILNIGENVESIPSYLFEGSCITEINFNDNNKCSSIGEQAFWACEKLKEITIPQTITTIGKKAFSCCTNLETIYFNAIECSNFTENHKIFDKRYEEDKTYKVIFGTSVKCIPDYLFYRCKWINEAQFAENCVCESIGNKSFYWCMNLQKSEVPKTVISIGELAFASCKNLKEIHFNASMCAGFNNSTVTPFYNSGSQEITTIYIGKDVEYIPAGMFNMAENVSRVIFDKESKCDTICAGAFYYCNKLEYIILSSQVNRIEDFALRFYASQVDIYCLGLGEPEISSISNIGNIYHYIETQPQENNRYWHYDTDGKTPIIWEIAE